MLMIVDQFVKCKNGIVVFYVLGDIHSVLAIQGRNFGIVAASNCSKPGDLL